MNLLDLQLFDAIKSNNTAELKRLLSAGANPNARDEKGRTPVFYFNTQEQLKLLLNAGADINVRDEFNKTPLMELADQKDPPMKKIKLLLEHGANINAEDTYGWTPLWYAVYHMNYELFELLLQKGADPYALEDYEITILNLAIGQRIEARYDPNPQRKLQMDKILIKLLDILDLKEIALLDMYYSHEYDILTSIMCLGFFNATKFLLEQKNFDIFYKNHEGSNLLHIVAEFGRYEDVPKIAEYLIKKGINVNEKNKLGETPLIKTTKNRVLFDKEKHIAIIYNLIKILLQYGADVNIKDNNGYTALDYAIKNYGEKHKITNLIT